MVARDGFSELLQRPVRGRMRGHVIVQNATAPYLHHQENITHLESDVHRNQKAQATIPWARFLTNVLQCCDEARVHPAPSSCFGQYLRTVRGETHTPDFNDGSSAPPLLPKLCSPSQSAR